MKWWVTLLGVVGTIEVLFVASGPGGSDSGVALISAAVLAGAWSYREMVRKGGKPSENLLRAQREILFGYECLFLGSANLLAGPHVLPLLATVGAAALACGQTVILWLVFKNPVIARRVERPRCVKDLSVREIIAVFAYLSAGMLGGAVYLSRSEHLTGAMIPAELQWPGLALLYVAFCCLALSFACEHSRASVAVYAAAAFVTWFAVWSEYYGRQNWYFLALSLFAFYCLVPGWPRAAERVPSGPPLNKAAQPDS